jgi:hypothetical protein
MKLFLFLRDIIWTSVLSLAAILASIIFALLENPHLPLPLAISAVALAVLTDRAKR